MTSPQVQNPTGNQTSYRVLQLPRKAREPSLSKPATLHPVVLKSQLSLRWAVTRCCGTIPSNDQFYFLFSWDVGEEDRPHVRHTATGFCVDLLHFNMHVN